MIFNFSRAQVEMKYDLYAVIVHIGFSYCSGHYYSFIRSAPNEWYKFDDSKVYNTCKVLCSFFMIKIGFC